MNEETFGPGPLETAWKQRRLENAMDDTNRGMPAFRVMYENGQSYVTSMAKGITLAQARDYFVGKPFEQHDEKTVLVVQRVDPVYYPPGHPDNPTPDTGWRGRQFKVKADVRKRGAQGLSYARTFNITATSDERETVVDAFIAATGDEWELDHVISVLEVV